jgi:hypothetical protein
VVQAAARLLTMVAKKKGLTQEGEGSRERFKGLGTHVLAKVQGTSVGTCWLTLHARAYTLSPGRSGLTSFRAQGFFCSNF